MNVEPLSAPPRLRLAGGFCRLATVLPVVCGVAFAGQDERRDSTPHWRTTQSCGVSSAYVLLGLLGHRKERHITYADVRAAIPVSENGTTLAELAQGCRKLGLPAKAIFAAPDELDRVALPAIAHLAPADATRSTVGHYVVVLSVRGHQVDVIDPTQPGVGYLHRGNFLRQWSGYLIVQDPSDSRESIGRSRHDLVLIAAAGVALLVVLVLVLARRRKSSRKFILFILLAISFPICVGGCGTENGSVSPQIADESRLMVHVWKSEEDLGNFIPGESKRSRFVIINAGSIPADLEIGQPTCACTSVNLSKTRLMPGENAELNVELRNHNKTGAFAGRVSVGAAGREWAEQFSVYGFGLGINLETKALAWSRQSTAVVRLVVLDIYTAKKGGDCRVTAALSSISDARQVFKVGQVRTTPARWEEGHWTRKVSIPVSIRAEAYSRLHGTTVGQLSIRVSCASIREEKVVDLKAIVE